MFENYTSKKIKAKRMPRSYVNDLEDSIDEINMSVDEGSFNFDVPLDDDAASLLRLIPEDSEDLQSAVRTVFGGDIFSYECIKDEQGCEHYDFITYRTSGEKADIGFAYYEPLNRFEVMIVVEFQKGIEQIWYEQGCYRNCGDNVYRLIKNGLILMSAVEKAIVQCRENS